MMAGPSTDQRIPTESQKSPQTPMTHQHNGTTEKHSPNPESAPLSQNETVNKTKCTTKKPQAYLKFSSNIEVSVRPNKISSVFCILDHCLRNLENINVVLPRICANVVDVFLKAKAGAPCIRSVIIIKSCR